ncbi:MAG: translocation/assembly module TamB domain-containing protein, partial [Candidatus Binatia bacterium]
RNSSPAKIAGEVEGRTERLGSFAAFVNVQLEGRGRARAEFDGTVENASLRGAAELADLSVEGVRFGAVRGPFEISSAGLRSEGIVIQDGELEAKGTIALTGSQENDWSALARQASVAQALVASRMFWPRAPEASGRLDGEVTVAGRWQDPRVDVQARITQASLGAERLGTVSVEVTRAGGRWEVRASLRREDDARADVQASWAADGALRGQGTAAGWRFENLESVSRRWPALRGAISFRGSLAGSTAQPLGEGELEISDLALARQHLDHLRVHARLEGERALIEATTERIRVSATAAISAPHAFRLRADWRDLDLGPLLVPETELEVRSAGTGELDGDADMPLAQGSARVTELHVGRGADVLRASTPVAVSIERGAIEVSEVVLGGSGQRLRFGARLTAAESEFHAVGTGDLALLESISPSVASARGRVDVELRGRRGSADGWRYHGTLDLSGGALDLGFLVGITDIAGHAELEGRELSLRELTGKIGGGDFLVAGSLALDRGWDLGWALHQGSLGVPSWLDYRASGNGRLTGLAFAPRFSGEIEVTQALYDRRIEWVEFLPWFRRQARPLRTPGGIPVAIDLHVFADDGVFIDNNLVQAEMRGDLRLRSREESLAWTGTIEVLGGEFVFRRRRFEITGGNVRFHEDRPMNPDLDFDGETSVTTREDEYEITVHVGGTAENPRVVFNADDPSLTENDVLALVTFGRTVAELEGQGGGIDVGEVLAITGPEGGRVQEQIQRLLRIDRIEIEPAYSRVSGVSEPRLRIAKDVTDRFSAILGAGLGSERQQDVAVEYQLTRGLSLQGFWESQTRSTEGTFGGSLKFRVPFRSFTLLPDSFQRLAEP